MADWIRKRRRSAFLALENGEVFAGYSVGAEKDVPGEAVFNTAMTGYQEVITDPSYSGQFVVFTSPEIGNYGVNTSDMESGAVFLNGIAVRELNPPSNFRSEETLEDFLKAKGVAAIAGVDTRRLTLVLRSEGSQKAFLHCSQENMTAAEGVERARAWEGLEGRDYASAAGTDKIYPWNSSGNFRVAALDFGIKRGILRELERIGAAVTVFPARTQASEILSFKPDGVFISNGPADPRALKYAVETVRNLVGRAPLMGICMGHQLMGLALGGDCVRLKFGHHGCNHPVKNLVDNRVEITSQNHSYAVDFSTLPREVELTHINLNDGTAEGFRHAREPLFCVQYHPEAAPGPDDSRCLFDYFKVLMER